MLFFRSLLFNMWMVSTAAVLSTVAGILGPLNANITRAIAVFWARINLAALRLLCRLDHRIIGLENIPPESGIALWKHQSTWETLAQFLIFPRQTWVMKKELLWVPLLGWAVYTMKPIAINRQAGRNAVLQVLSQGRDRLERGLWVMIFPEGTRMPPGTTRKYGLSGALLASETGHAIIPIAHNAGDFWPRRGFIKKPGTITVCIGAPIPTQGRTPEDINREAQNWIETRMKEISPGYPGVWLEKKRKTPGTG